MSERQFAKHVGASLSSVQDRRKAGLLPRSARQDARGRWRIDATVGAEEWTAFAPLRVPTGGDDSEVLRAWREARARRETALAKLAEDDLRRRRGELLEAEKVRAAIEDDYARCRTKLLGIPTRVRQRCPSLTLSDVREIEDAIRDALQELADGRF